VVHQTQTSVDLTFHTAAESALRGCCRRVMRRKPRGDSATATLRRAGPGIEKISDRTSGRAARAPRSGEVEHGGEIAMSR